MSDQKALKKRLKALMAQPHNQICIDCNEKKPTWASLIVPPPGCPPGTEKMGAFVCLECSGSHRRLGVHIAFVRSVNLDAWKDWEVIAMENGGNSKINAIFEAKLAQSGRQKLTNLDNGPTRERYIRDKYERRKFYDPAAFSQDFSALQAAAAAGSAGSSGGSGGGGPRPGAPSDIARQRVASRQARMKPAASNITDAHSSSYNASAASAPGRKVAQAPVSAPVTVDLLDFGSDPSPAPTPAAPAPAAAAATSTDLFGGDPFSSPAAPAPIAAPAATQQTPAPAAAATSSTSNLTLSQELMSSPAPAKPSTSNDSIMALFGGPPKQQSFAPQSYGMQAMAGMNPTGVNNGNMQGMQAAGMNPQMMQQQQMMMMQQQQQQQQRQGQQMMGMNMNNAGGGGGGGGMMMNNNNMQGMMTPQMQQQMMMAQQMQMQMQQQKQMPQQQQMNGNMGGMNMMTNPAMMNNMMGSMNNNNNNSGGATAPNNMMNNNFNAAMMGMQNMNMGGGSGAGGIATSASGDDGGFGAPMGGNASSGNSSNDAFASLGGMNAFR